MTIYNNDSEPELQMELVEQEKPERSWFEIYSDMNFKLDLILARIEASNE
jgi:hypothetical protein